MKGKDPFDIPEEEKVAILLSRLFYLRSCEFKGDRPQADPLHTGTGVLRSNARIAVNFLGYDDNSMDRLMAENELAYESAMKAHEKRITAA